MKRVVGFLVLLLMAFGCRTNDFPGVLLVQPPKRPNAALVANDPLTLDNVATRELAEGSTIEVLARIDRVQRYVTRIDARSLEHWHLITAKVLEVLRGCWSSRNLIFVARAKHAGPNSIMGEFPGFPYLRGRFFEFGLRKSRPLPEIIFQERRNWFMPYGRLDGSWFPSLTLEAREELVTKLVEKSLIDLNMHAFDIEVTDRFCVMESWDRYTFFQDYNSTCLYLFKKQTLELVDAFTGADWQKGFGPQILKSESKDWRDAGHEAD